MERRNERMLLQTVAEARCSAVTAASPAVYLMMLFFLFCINLEFRLRVARNSLCSFWLWNSLFLSFFFLPPFSSAHMGKQSFSLCRASPPFRWCQTLQGVHSLSPCLPSIMQSLMDSTQGRRHGQPDHWEHKQKPPQPPPTPILLFPPLPESICVHTWTPVLAYTSR